jgi:hypothetical protein
MKVRYAIVAGLILVLLGVAVLASTKTATIVIGSYVNLIWPSGDLWFSSAAAAPGESGWFESNHRTASVEGNCDYSMTVGVTQFSTGTYTLPTKLGGTAFKVNGATIDPAITGALPVLRDAPETWVFKLYYDGDPLTSSYPNYYGHGGAKYSGDFFLKVDRNGYNDHAGTYSATITVTVSVL